MKLFGLIFAAATAAPISGSDYLLYQSLQRGDNSFNPFLFGLSTKEIIQIMVACLEISISQPQCCSPMATWLVWTWIISCLSIYWVETKLHPIKWLLFLLSMLHKLIKMSSQDIIRSKKFIKNILFIMEWNAKRKTMLRKSIKIYPKIDFILVPCLSWESLDYKR